MGIDIANQLLLNGTQHVSLGNVGADTELDAPSEKMLANQKGHIIENDSDAASGALLNNTDQNESKTSKVMVRTVHDAEKEQDPNVDVNVQEKILSKGKAENQTELAPSGRIAMGK